MHESRPEPRQRAAATRRRETYEARPLGYLVCSCGGFDARPQQQLEKGQESTVSSIIWWRKLSGSRCSRCVFTLLLSGFSSVYIHKTKKSTSPQTCPEMSIMMMMMILSRSSYKKITIQYVYTSTPLQQYQYVPKETVRHQASCEEVYTYIRISRITCSSEIMN